MNRPLGMTRSAMICFISLSGFTTVQAQITWRRSYGGHGSDAARSVKQTIDGGYVVAGSTGSFGTGGDGYLVKLDELGEVQWSRYFGGAQVDEFHDVEVLSDGYLVVGITGSPSNGGYDGLLMRLDASGALQWRQNYGSMEWDFLYSVDAVEDGYFLSGTTYSDPSLGGECWILRTDLDGEVLWSTTTGGADEDEARGVRASADGGCVFAGSMGDVNGGSNAFVGKIDPSGGVEWDLSWGTDSVDKAFGLDIMDDGSIIVGGFTRGFASYQQLLLAKIDPTGALIWSNNIGQITDWEGHAVRARPTGGFAMAAFTKAFGFGGKDMYLLLADSDGQYEFGTTFGGVEDDEANALDLTADGAFVVAGSTDSYGPGTKAMFVVKTGTDGLTESQDVEEYFDPVGMDLPVAGRSESIGPNPVRSNGILKVYNLERQTRPFDFRDELGRIVGSGFMGPQGVVQVPSLATGVYWLRLYGLSVQPRVFRIVVLEQ
ncbi:MAG: hypothetical protein JNL43_03185 [Flavobacteriales bacterium]|nr:hypothetical protein [Flavobacteriales bacterium]